MIYTVTLNPALDYVVQVPDFRAGKTNRMTQETFLPGGKGINVSIVLGNLGIANRLFGFLAGFTGEEIQRRLTLQGCDCRFLTLPQGCSRINVKLKGAQETEVNAAGPAIPAESMQQLRQQLDTLETGDMLVLAGSIPKQLSQDTYCTIMQQLAEKKIAVVVDAEGDLLRCTLAERPFLIKPNHHELGQLFGVSIQQPEQAVAYAKQLQEAGARNVLVSMSKQGAILCAENGMVYRQAAASGTVVNSVGAGDSMVAGFLAGWQKTGDYQMALRMGAAAGAASAFSAHLATGEEVTEILYNRLPDTEQL
jgi:1-phosphofructokinase